MGADIAACIPTWYLWVCFAEIQVASMSAQESRSADFPCSSLLILAQVVW